MLFNTLAFAKFFAFVFLVSWVLVSRRSIPLLPWFALLGYVVFASPTGLGWGLLVLSGLLTAGLCRLTPREGPLPGRIAAAAVATNFIALAFCTYSESGVDPLTLGLRTLRVTEGVPWLVEWITGSATTASLLQVWTGTALILAPVLGFLIVRARKVRMVFILLASYVFYAHWDWRFLPLIFASSTIDWLLGNAIYRARSSSRRRWWILGTVFVNLGILGTFKYFNFGIDSAEAVLESLGYEQPAIILALPLVGTVNLSAVEIALPVGISFFTFESMSYVIDIYRGDIRPQQSYVEYLAFVAFFPHLVAGPIVRPRDLLPQLAGAARWSSAEGSEGLFLVAVGLLKKIAIGDYLAVNLVDRVFDAPLQYSALECYSAVLGYAVQIYCDFSGYTDIAIGVALLLGVRMPLNFNAPYKSPEIIDFWRRWHISLSTWLRDYLYISLGGNRRGRVATYANLMTTMLLGGLWHGASWTFLVWGGLHGWALAVTRAVGESSRRVTRLLALVVPALIAGPLLGSVMCLFAAPSAGVFAPLVVLGILSFVLVQVLPRGRAEIWGLIVVAIMLGSLPCWAVTLLWTGVASFEIMRDFLLIGAGLGVALAVGALHRDWEQRNRKRWAAEAHAEPWRPVAASPLWRRTRALSVAVLLGPVSGLVGLVASGVGAGFGTFARYLAFGWVLGALHWLGLLLFRGPKPQAESIPSHPLRDDRRDLTLAVVPPTPWGKLFRVVSLACTFHVVCAGWVFFRAESFQHAALYFSRLLTLSTYHPNLPQNVVAVLLVGLASHFVPERWYMIAREFFIVSPPTTQGACLLVAGLVLRAMASAEAVPFVYFQF